MTMDGINNNYFKDAAKAKTNEEKPQLNSLAGGRLRVLLYQRAMMLSVSFDEPIQKTVKVKENVHEKPTMNVAARMGSPILPPTNETGKNHHSL